MPTACTNYVCFVRYSNIPNLGYGPVSRLGHTTLLHWLKPRCYRCCRRGSRSSAWASPASPPHQPQAQLHHHGVTYFISDQSQDYIDSYSCNVGIRFVRWLKMVHWNLIDGSTWMSYGRRKMGVMVESSFGGIVWGERWRLEWSLFWGHSSFLRRRRLFRLTGKVSTWKISLVFVLNGIPWVPGSRLASSRWKSSSLRPPAPSSYPAAWKLFCSISFREFLFSRRIWI